MTTIFYFVLLLFGFVMQVDCLKILGLFPHPGSSHFHFFHPIMRGLAEAGHDVTIVSHFPDKNPPMHYKDLPITGVPLLNDSVNLQVFENRPIYGHILEFFMLYEWGKNACEHTLKSEALNKVMKSGKQFDVVIMEQFNNDCMMGVAYKLKAPAIGLSSCALMPWHYERFGAPLIPAYIPALFHGFSEDMTFLQRLGNWFTIHLFQFLYKFYTDAATTDLLRKKFGNDMPNIAEISKQTSLMFVNQHFSLSGAKPLPPSIIELGGVHIQRTKTLDVELQRILDSAENGVIYISWGSMIRAETMPAAKREGMLRALGRLRQTVLWKWENDTIPKKPSNVYVRKWLPQREILCHPKTRVFFTHGGLMGSTEAAYCGVPVVATPMYGDQFLNSAALKHRGMGVVLNYEDITEATVFKSVQKVLEPKFIDSAKAVSFSFKQRPQKALETAIWWVEYVAKTEGAPLLQTKATDISKFVYHSLDIYSFFASMFVFSLLSWMVLAKWFSGKLHFGKAKKD